MGKRMRWFSIIRNNHLCIMLIVIFTYNREQMLINLLNELKDSPHEVLIIEDGDNYDVDKFKPFNREDWKIISNQIHGGKQLFWKRWEQALNEIPSYKHEWICFMPDDISQINLPAIESFTKQGWGNMRVAINLSNSGTRYRWGKYSSGQPDIEIDGMLLQECGWVDGLFLTNRYTLEGIQMDEVPESWFNRPDKSSGVGYQLTKKFQSKRVKMMLPEYSYCFHGDHESVMHPEHRKEVPLISKMKP